METWYMVAVGNVGDPIVDSVKYDDCGEACDVSRNLMDRGVTSRVLKITEVAIFRGITPVVLNAPVGFPRADCMSRSKQPGCPCRACSVIATPLPGCGCTTGCKAWDCPNV